MRRRTIALSLALSFATAAMAHQGVQNPAVMTRMEAMTVMGKNFKALGRMWTGAAPFDAAAARMAAAEIAREAAATPALFEAHETDPTSEALPLIWRDFADFTEKAKALETIASGLAQSISAPADVGAAVEALGANCKSCHSLYRQ